MSIWRDDDLNLPAILHSFVEGHHAGNDLIDHLEEGRLVATIKIFPFLN